MTFSFLDLPPELRNRVYSFLFHSRTPESYLDLAEAKRHIPQRALTHTCQQLRAETLNLHHDVARKFQSANFWAIGINNLIFYVDCTTSGSRRYCHKNDILSELYHLHLDTGPGGLKIRRLKFSVKAAEIPYINGHVLKNPEVDVEVIKTMTRGLRVRWHYMFEQGHRCRQIADAGLKMNKDLEKWYGRHLTKAGFALHSGPPKPVLHTETCVRAIFSCFQFIPGKDLPFREWSGSRSGAVQPKRT